MLRLEGIAVPSPPAAFTEPRLYPKQYKRLSRPSWPALPTPPACQLTMPLAVEPSTMPAAPSATLVGVLMAKEAPLMPAATWNSDSRRKREFQARVLQPLRSFAYQGAFQEVPLLKRVVRLIPKRRFVQDYFEDTREGGSP